MPLTTSKIRSLKGRAADNSLEVEHLLEVAMLGDASDVPLLRQFKREHGWSETGWQGRKRVVPFGRWADVVCCFLEQGYKGLLTLLREDEVFVEYCLGLLEELKTPESVSTLLAIGAKVMEQPEVNRPLAFQLADAFNLLLSFKGAPKVEDFVATEIRNFLHRLLSLEWSEAERATIVCALRGVGDTESLKLLAKLPPFRGCWSGLETSATRQIKRRIRGKSK